MMQTFLPYPDFQRSVEVLDYRRLGKQRVEAKQILNALAGKSRGWTNHTATRMWRGFEPALAAYMDACIDEWVKRGYNNTMQTIRPALVSIVLPPWFGDEAFHASHRSNLLRKKPEYYGQFGWVEGPDLPYVWPV
jgi:hypothetical protein